MMGDWQQRRRLVANARSLRKNLTDEERKLWRRLRHEQLGVRFRRQAPQGPYIADFLCHSPKLIVELDGGQHSEQREYDEQRTMYLESEGFRVLRFWNHEVNSDVERVVEIIDRFIQDQLEKTDRKQSAD